MQIRPATPDDLPVIAALQQRWDTAWFGAPELDEVEIGQSFKRVDPLASHSRLVVDGDRLLAAAWWWGTSTTLLVDPAVAAAMLLDDLIAWFEAQDGPAIEALSRDEQLIATLRRRGWQHVRSSFELIRQATPDWQLAAPHWPAGIDLRDFHRADAQAVHRLIYVDAGWGEIPGHPERSFAEWLDLFVTDETLPEQQVLAFRGDRLAGVAMGRTFSDNTGWISQLAVAKHERGHGLGRALLLEALRRRLGAGATALGLSVQAENGGAISLYLGVGLSIDREWQEFARPS